MGSNSDACFLVFLWHSFSLQTVLLWYAFFNSCLVLAETGRGWDCRGFHGRQLRRVLSFLLILRVSFADSTPMVCFLNFSNACLVLAETGRGRDFRGFHGRQLRRVLSFLLIYAFPLQTVLLWYAFLISLMPALFLQRLARTGLSRLPWARIQTRSFFSSDFTRSLC